MPAHRLPPTRVPESPPLMLDLAARGISTIIWATGYLPDYSWLDFPCSIARGWSATTAASRPRPAST